MGEPGFAALRGAAAQSASTKLVCFFLHGQEYGAAIEDVVETLAVRAITRVFLTPAWVAGIMNLRGDVVPVLDLALLLEMPPALVTEDSRIVLIRHQELRAGLLVDGLAELRQVDLAQLEPAPATLPPEVTGLLRGIATMGDGAVVRVLDLPALLESDRVRTLDGLR